MDIEIKKLQKKKTKSGFLIEFLKSTELNNQATKHFQVYAANILPNETRVNHYHKEKEEWYLIFDGKVKVILEDVKTKEKEKIILDSSKDFSTRICIPPGIAHIFTNISNSTIFIIAYTNKIYDPENPDTYEHRVL